MKSNLEKENKTKKLKKEKQETLPKDKKQELENKKEKGSVEEKEVKKTRKRVKLEKVKTDLENEDGLLEDLEEELEIEGYYHFIESGKLEDCLKTNLKKYKVTVLDLIQDYKEDEEISKENLFNNLVSYIAKEYKAINEERNNNTIRVAEKYSEYITFIFLKNRFISKKKFRQVLLSLHGELILRDGGSLINVQFKDLNLLAYVHK